jgi:hypothetical protein
VVPLSVLDLVPIGSGSTATPAPAASTALARRVDELGYTRTPGRVRTPDEAAAYPYSDQERAFIEHRMAGQIIGSSAAVSARPDGVSLLLGVAEKPALIPSRFSIR